MRNPIASAIVDTTAPKPEYQYAGDDMECRTFSILLERLDMLARRTPADHPYLLAERPPPSLDDG